MKKPKKMLPMNKCPICGGDPFIDFRKKTVFITCARNMCRMVDSRDYLNAIQLWNRPKDPQGI